MKNAALLRSLRLRSFATRTAYWALVTRMDVMIGQILTALRENGLDENTLILYSSDHGEQIGEHGLWWKQTFYEHSVKVPAILSWRGALPEGGRCDRVVSSLDLNATMLDALGAPPLSHSRGRSTLPLLRGEDAHWEDRLHSLNIVPTTGVIIGWSVRVSGS